MMTQEKLDQWMDGVSKCWENMGLHLGFKSWRNEDEQWCARMHLLPVIIDGQRAEPSEDTLDLLHVLDSFDKDSIVYFSVHNAEITIEGKVDGETVCLEIYLYVPDDAEPVDEIHKDGSWSSIVSDDTRSS